MQHIVCDIQSMIYGIWYIIIQTIWYMVSYLGLEGLPCHDFEAHMCVTMALGSFGTVLSKMQGM